MKQFIVDRHTTPSTPTLEQVPTEKIPIYDDLDAVTADLANLSAGQLVATPDTGDELSQPVDVVESGNLRAVTSNAVAGSCPRFPDYENGSIYTSESASITLTEDCYIVYNVMAGNSTNRNLKINGVAVSITDNVNSVYVTTFSGYAKKDDILTRGDSGNLGTNALKIFKLR